MAFDKGIVKNIELNDHQNDPSDDEEDEKVLQELEMLISSGDIHINNETIVHPKNEKRNHFSTLENHPKSIPSVTDGHGRTDVQSDEVIDGVDDEQHPCSLETKPVESLSTSATDQGEQTQHMKTDEYLQSRFRVQKNLVSSIELETYVTHPYLHLVKNFQALDWQLSISKSTQEVTLKETPLVEVVTVSDLMSLVRILSTVKLFALHVHHKNERYGSYVNVMEISTGVADYIIDTVALRNDMSLLSTIFGDPNVVKVMYGSDLSDFPPLCSLQRYFHLFIVNLFDVAEASRSLNEVVSQFSVLLVKRFPERRRLEMQLSTIPQFIFSKMNQRMRDYYRHTSHYLIQAYHKYKNRLIHEGQYLLYQVIEKCNIKCMRTYGDIGHRHYTAIKREIKIRQECEEYVLEKIGLWLDHVANTEKKRREVIFPVSELVRVVHCLPSTFSDLTAIAPSLSLIKTEFIENLASIIQNSVTTFNTTYNANIQKISYRNQNQDTVAVNSDNRPEITEDTQQTNNENNEKIVGKKRGQSTESNLMPAKRPFPNNDNSIQITNPNVTGNGQCDFQSLRCLLEKFREVYPSAIIVLPGTTITEQQLQQAYNK